jgi:hypothetical protein
LVPQCLTLARRAGDDEISAQNTSPDVIDRGDGTDTVTYDAADTITNCEDVSTG